MKQTIILISLASLFVLTNGLYIYYLFTPDAINVWEIRYYLFIGVILFTLLTFGVLRIYNAIVVNSRYLRSSKNDAVKTIASINQMTKSIDNNTNENKKLKTVITSQKTMFSSSIEKLKTSIDIFARKNR